jgi:hypothetical protein
MYFPSFVNFTMRPFAFGGRLSFWPLWPSDTKMSPFGAVITSVGSLSVSGPLPGTPAFPSVIKTLPSGLNLNT